MITFTQALPAIVLVVIFIALALRKGTPLKKLLWQSALVIVLACAVLYVMYRP